MVENSRGRGKTEDMEMDANGVDEAVGGAPADLETGLPGGYGKAALPAPVEAVVGPGLLFAPDPIRDLPGPPLFLLGQPEKGVRSSGRLITAQFHCIFSYRHGDIFVKGM